MHPSILISRDPRPGCRTVERLRKTVKEGHAKVLWDSILARAEYDLRADPLLPTSRIEGRSDEQAEIANPDWVICGAARSRVKRAAVAALVTKEGRYIDEALRQLEVLFDADKWPRWRDHAHPRNSADLRTGMLGGGVGLAYDWLSPLLTDRQREWIVEGMDRCAVEPFFAAVEEGARWITGCSNWTTCVVGGMGIAGMALGDSHPRAAELVDLSVPIMKGYLERAYGPEGEFNESVGYSSATGLPMAYYAALRCYDPDYEDVLASSPFPEALTWYMHFVLPPGRLVAFGDSHWDAPPESAMFALAAQATGNPAFQQFYLDHLHDGVRRDFVDELLWYDPEVEAASDDSTIPRGKVYSAFGKCISSRSTWDSRSTPTMVCGKAGIEDHHEHHDLGQMTIDGYGERLIIDLGSPPGYPADFFGPNRYRYYNASSRGHNILSIDGAEMAHGAQGRIEASEFADDRGGWWSMDATEAYPAATSVRRRVFHLTPCIVAVLDEAEIPDTLEVSLRWHTVGPADPTEDGTFVVQTRAAVLGAMVVDLDGAGMAFRRREHSYSPPFDKARTGFPLEQKHESFVEATATASRWRSLSLFAVGPAGEVPAWEASGSEWTTSVLGRTYTVGVSEGSLKVREERSDRAWVLEL